MNLRLGDNDHRTIISYSHQTSDGYRQQSQMRRDVASWETLLKAATNRHIHAYILYSDLYYQTPGALTLAEYNKDPRMARPGSATQPSAIQAKAAIFQKNFTAGFSNEYHFNAHWQNTTAVYGAYTDFTNPGIRVYELRQEPHFGGRSVFQYKTELGATSLQVNAGAEAQKGFSKRAIMPISWARRIPWRRMTGWATGSTLAFCTGRPEIPGRLDLDGGSELQ